MLRGVMCIGLSLFLGGCAGLSKPTNIDNICEIFAEKPTWKDALIRSEAKWGIPVAVNASIIYQESSFRYDARPSSKAKLFGIGVGRASSAYGFAQALDATWKDYQKETGNWRSRRDNFSDAVDFMGWFNSSTIKINNISKYDARDLYYNYHEGWGGYRRGTHKKKSFLMNSANKVQKRSINYAKQLKSCKGLNSGSVLFRL